MRAGHLLLVVAIAIGLLVISPGNVSARCPDPESITLNPGKACDRQECKTDCANKYHDGVGVCLNPRGCYCEFCLDHQSNLAASPPSA
ncbi:hypothetical protein BS78_04G294100 [Paspalum vaginatum]|nr:hypothetical protein BS78_04G294100 [Paspalum vaginatum]